MVKGISIKNLVKLFPGDLYQYLEMKLDKWNGLELSKNRLFLNEKGIMLADEIASDLFIE